MAHYFKGFLRYKYKFLAVQKSIKICDKAPLIPKMFSA